MRASTPAKGVGCRTRVWESLLAATPPALACELAIPHLDEPSGRPFSPGRPRAFCLCVHARLPASRDRRTTQAVHNTMSTREDHSVASRLLLIEDDKRLAEMVRDYLSGAGYRVTHVATGGEGVRLEERETFDAIVLDLMLPDMDGLDVCRQVRGRSGVPILMLTARGDAMDRVVGLEVGADDYLPKPFEPRELLARLKAILRRGRSTPAASNTLTFGRLEVDLGAREARIEGNRVELTSAQFALLMTLAEHAGRVLTREQLMDLVKGERLEAFDRSIDVHISRIRQAIEDDPKKPRRIITVRGAGYVFAKSQD